MSINNNKIMVFFFSILSLQSANWNFFPCTNVRDCFCFTLFVLPFMTHKWSVTPTEKRNVTISCNLFLLNRYNSRNE